MGALDIFSKRQRRLRGEMPDVYDYDQMPKELRVQVIHIMRDMFGNYHAESVKGAYKALHDALCREYGVFHLSKEARWDQPRYDKAVESYFLEVEDHERALDIIELAFSIRNELEKDYSLEYHSGYKLTADSAIEELNQRFQEHGIGYQFEANCIVRTDSKYVHAEVVKPTLTVLGGPEYRGANDEFIKAHEHY